MPDKASISRVEQEKPLVGGGSEADGKAVLSPQHQAFMQSGVYIVAGTVLKTGYPMAATGHGCCVEQGGQVRISICPVTYSFFVEAIEQGQPIAATFTRPEDHTSIQIKASGAALVQANPRDVEAARTQSAIFSDRLVKCTFEKAFSDAFVSHDGEKLVVVEFMPMMAFLQTPGPSAGTALKS